MAQKKPGPKRRSGCPLNASVEMLGDRWSLLIVRDMMIRGFRSFQQFLDSDERIATNILAAKGIGLAPVLAEMVLWAADHEKTGNQQLVQMLRRDKDKVIAEVGQ